MAGCSRTLRDSEIDLVISSDCDDSSECSDVPELCEVVGGIEDVVRSDHSGRGSDGEPDNDLHQLQRAYLRQGEELKLLRKQLASRDRQIKDLEQLVAKLQAHRKHK
ncbi:hypothetical protein J6590_048515 [Homalodisca vitripennis]|nr:hypothetical protein J6590_048515 [Homalodisca vitripennis]